MSFYWYDFETFGTDPFRDRPAQFAGLRTDADFNPIGEPLVLYCQPADDMLPQPGACLVTGITPQLAAERGLIEAEFIARIHAELSQPQTCTLGYNTLRFDDEVVRNTLYRNFYDPYAREWQNGNSRWDLIDLVRLARAVRPEGINWPNHPDGKPSFRLEDLTAANGIEHQGAHDAMADVWATIALARLLKTKQPRLFDYYYQQRDKRQVEAQLNLLDPKPVLHISAKYAAEKGCAALVMPLARDRVNKNALYVFDLSSDPAPLLELSAEQIRARIFTPTAELPEGVERIPLKAVHTNKCPILAPLTVVTAEVAQRLVLDLDRCAQHYGQLIAAVQHRGDDGLAAKIAEVFANPAFRASDDPDLMLYSGGFFSDGDRRLLEELRQTPPEQLGNRAWPFRDQRLPEMLLRYRARNYPHSLSAQEQAQWQDYRRRRLSDPEGGGSIVLTAYFEELRSLQQSLGAKRERDILKQLLEYGEGLQAGLAS